MAFESFDDEAADVGVVSTTKNLGVAARVGSRRREFDFSFRRASGGCQRKPDRDLVPEPGSLLSRTVPPDCCAIPYTWLNPSPVPLPIGLVVKNGSNTRSSRCGGMPGPVSLTVITPNFLASMVGNSPSPKLLRIAIRPPSGIASRE